MQFLEEALKFYGFCCINPTDWNTDLAEKLKNNSRNDSFYSISLADLNTIKENTAMGGWVLVCAGKPLALKNLPKDWFNENQLDDFFKMNDIDLLISSYYDDNEWIIIAK